MALPEIHVVAGTTDAATELGPVAQALRLAGLLVPVLVAGGADPAAVGAAFTELNLIADLTLPAAPALGLIARFDRMWSNRAPAAVLVAGSDPAGLSAALAAAWRDIPVAHLNAGVRSDEVAADQESDARIVTQVARIHLIAHPIDAMNLLDEGVPAKDLMISGDDTLAPRRAAQAVASMAGLAPPPAPMPVTIPPAAVRFGG
jgi:UDP-N-acetylglucosamine 2-epimerase (non-hydrolysing)